MGLFNSMRRSEQGFRFRPLTRQYVDAALTIVYNHDEDDGQEAEAALCGDLSAFHMVEIDGQLAGFTGYSRIVEAPTSAWLSWTYVDEGFRRQGVGTYLIAEISALLAKRGVDRLFISTSDYKDDGVDIYAEARRFYERVGARCDLKIPDFYQRDEAKYIFRLPLGEQGFGYPDTPLETSIKFVDIDLLDETDTAWYLLWEEQNTNTPGLDETRHQEELTALITRAQTHGAHAIFASLASPQSSAASMQLQRAGFRNLGSVTDYYGSGLNDVYWAKYLNA